MSPPWLGLAREIWASWRAHRRITLIVILVCAVLYAFILVAEESSIAMPTLYTFF